jgi:hypothetical protein
MPIQVQYGMGGKSSMSEHLLGPVPQNIGTLGPVLDWFWKKEIPVLIFGFSSGN